MILNPEWHKPKEKPYFHQISMDCLEKLVDCIAKINNDDIDADTSCEIEKQILTDEIVDPEFLNFACWESDFRLNFIQYTEKYNKEAEPLQLCLFF